MKYIRKAGSPQQYAQWCVTVAGTNKNNFRELPKSEKQVLLNALIHEQGGLCAYTMRRIGKDSSHVEHIKPQSVCKIELAGSDLDYANVVACFPRENAAVRYRYGAQEKGHWWEHGGKNFVSPLHPSCEQRFRFDTNGNIAPVRNSLAAVTTIKVLRLDHPTLTEDRRRVIKEFIYGRYGDEPLSRKQALDATRSICKRGNLGHFTEFCVAIRNALDDYIARLEKISKRRKFARKRG